MNGGLLEQLSIDIEPIIRSAGKLLLSYFHKQMEQTKKEDNSFVTEADRVTEQFLIKELSALIPDCAFVAEESGVLGLSDYCWVIDSLDGTTNFTRGLPYFCISVALTYKKQVILAVVYQPLLNEYFYARQDGQTSLNGVPIHVAHRNTVADSMIVVAVPYAKDECFMGILETIGQVAKTSYSFRYLGSVALDLAYVAAGRIDGSILKQCAWWDIAAGILLVEQAGGLVTDIAGNKPKIGEESLIAAAPLLQGELRKLLNSKI